LPNPALDSQVPGGAPITWPSLPISPNPKPETNRFTQRLTLVTRHPEPLSLPHEQR
jgi:hypothetical protein